MYRRAWASLNIKYIEFKGDYIKKIILLHKFIFMLCITLYIFMFIFPKDLSNDPHIYLSNYVSIYLNQTRPYDKLMT